MTYTDIVYPKDNEKDFFNLAKALGYTKLIFTYRLSSTKKDDIKKQTTEILDKKRELLGSDELKIETAILISEEDNKKLNNSTLNMLKEKDNLIFFDANDATDLRTVAKNKFINMILKQELTKNKDFMHQRNPGIDEVICRIAAESNTSFGFSMNDITNLKDKRIIGRTSQSLRVSKKHKNKINIFSFAKKPFEMKSPKDINSLYYLIGIDKKNARLAMKGF